MKKLVFVVLSLSLLIMSGCKADKQEEKDIKIGFIGPLTGDYANYGKLMTQAIKIAVEEKNAAGGIDGKMIKLIAEDSEGKVEKANAAMEKLGNADKVLGIIGAVFSSNSIAIAPRCEAQKIVMISPSSTHKDLPGKGEYIMRTVITDELQARVFAKYVSEKLDIKRVAILYTKNDYSQGIAQDFQTQFEADGGTITAVETGLQGDKDFKTQLTKIKGTNPQAIFLPNYVAEIAQILEQANQLGINVTMLSADGISNPEIFGLAADYAENVIFSGPEAGNELSRSFSAVYKEKWGEEPDGFSLNSYDGAKILIDAIEKAYNDLDKDGKAAFKIDREKIRQYVINTADYNGVSGKITFAPNGDVLKNIAVSKISGQEFIQLSVHKLDTNGNLVDVQ